MSWNRSVTEKIGDVLRFLAYACFAINAIVLAVFSVWFVAKLTWFFANWTNRVMFSSSW